MASNGGYEIMPHLPISNYLLCSNYNIPQNLVKSIFTIASISQIFLEENTKTTPYALCRVVASYNGWITHLTNNNDMLVYNYEN